MDAPDAEGLAPTSTISSGVQPFDNFFDAESTRVAVAVQIQLKNEPDRFGFDGVKV